MSLSIKLGNFLFKHAFFLYKPMYKVFKNKQDAFEIGLLTKHIRKGDTVLDIGANIGFYSVIISKLISDTGKVHCFEPDKKNYSYLKLATEGIKNIIINNKAVGSKTETLKIYTSKKLNVDHRTYKPDDYDEEITVEAVSVDDYLKENLRVNFIKIDIQGFEMQAIKGMQNILNYNKEVKIISEFWPYGLNKAGNSAQEYFNFFTQLGFNLFLLQNNALIQLNADKVTSLESLGEEKYFNVFICRNQANTSSGSLLQQSQFYS